MKYPYLFAILLLISSCNGSKRSITDSTTGIIQYDVHMDLNEDAQHMEEVFGDKAIATFSEKYLRLERNGNALGKEFQVFDLYTGIERTYLEVKDERFMVVMPKALIPSVGKFTYLDEYKKIAGYKCRKATAPMTNGELVVYFTNDIGVDFVPYADLEGFALEYTLELNYGKVTYSAQSVEFQKADPQLSHLPNGYKEVTHSEFQKEMMSLANEVEVGAESVEFTKRNLKGQLINSDQLKDKVVVINFWFSACKPCEMEMPDLNSVKASYKNNDNVVFLAVTYDSAKTVNRFLEKHTFDFNIIPDAHDLIKAYDVFVYPTTFILDQKGKVVDMKIGGSYNIQQELSEVINKLIE